MDHPLAYSRRPCGLSLVDHALHPLGPGLEAIATGYSLRFPDDLENLQRQFQVYDALYAWCRLQVEAGESS